MNQFKFFKGIKKEPHHVENHEFIGYTLPYMYFNNVRIKFRLYRNLQTGQIIADRMIFEGHPEWNEY